MEGRVRPADLSPFLLVFPFHERFNQRPREAEKAPFSDEKKINKEIQNDRMVKNKGLVVKIKRQPALFL
jgi:hypothetical protein